MQIYIEIDEKTITLEVENADTIESIKEKIEEKENINTSKQTLYYNDTSLEDGKTLQDYNIQKEVTVQCMVSEESLDAPSVQEEEEMEKEYRILIRKGGSNDVPLYAFESNNIDGVNVQKVFASAKECDAYIEDKMLNTGKYKITELLVVEGVRQLKAYSDLYGSNNND